MEKKRSIGVTIFAWLFIIGSIFGLAGYINPKPYFEFMGTGVFAYIEYVLRFIIWVCSLICGIYILKLQYWARQLLIVLCLVSITYSPIFYKKMLSSRNFEDRIYKKQEQMIIEKYKPEHQQEALERIERSRQMVKKVSPIFFAIVTGIVIGWNLLIIFFFTRPKVKAQFSPPTRPT